MVSTGVGSLHTTDIRHSLDRSCFG